MSQSEKNDLASALFWVEKRYGKRQYDVLLVGDSRTYQGVSPEILRKHVSHIGIYNFGFSGGRINRQLLKEAKKRLKKNGKRIFIFGCTSCNLQDEINEHFLSIREVTPVSFCLPAVWADIHGRYLQKNKGATGLGYFSQRCPKNEKSISETFKHYRARLQKRSFTASDFEKFVQNLKWCKRNNINVIAYRMVSCREMDELEDKFSGVDWDKIRQAVLNEDFVWLERPPSPLLEQIEAYCYDASHLNEEGSQLFSEWIGKELKKLEWFQQSLK